MHVLYTCIYASFGCNRFVRSWFTYIKAESRSVNWLTSHSTEGIQGTLVGRERDEDCFQGYLYYIGYPRRYREEDT
jgi:hypothetical protein